MNNYDILGLRRDATKDEIKKAFRRLAHQCHPDKPGGNEEEFKKINMAYQELMKGKTGGSPFTNTGFEGFRRYQWDSNDLWQEMGKYYQDNMRQQKSRQENNIREMYRNQLNNLTRQRDILNNSIDRLRKHLEDL